MKLKFQERLNEDTGHVEAILLIPNVVCDQLGWTLDDDIEFLPRGDGTVALRKVQVPLDTERWTMMTLWYFKCPIDGCSYRTGASGALDVHARNAVMAHLQRKMHGFNRAVAKDMACRAELIEGMPFDEAVPTEQE